MIWKTKGLSVPLIKSQLLALTYAGKLMGELIKQEIQIQKMLDGPGNVKVPRIVGSLSCMV